MATPFPALPLVIHKGIPAEYTLQADRIVVFKVTVNSQPQTIVWDSNIQSTWSTSTLEQADVGIHQVSKFGLGLLCDVGNLNIGAGVTNQLSKAETTLVAIDAVLEGKATADLQAYTVAGRAVTKMSVEDLLRLRARYLTLVQHEKAAIIGKKSQSNTFKNIVVR
jgi:hypothetical protein